jgi:hypothetical protein
MKQNYCGAECDARWFCRSDIRIFNPAKAIRELGLPQTPPKQALTDAVKWFRTNEYVGK